MSTQSSEHFTEDLNDADAVYVDEYCYTVAWIAKEQSEETYKDGFDPRAELVKGYKMLMEHPRHAAHRTNRALACLEDPTHRRMSLSCSRYQGNNGSTLVIISASPAWSMGGLHKVACEVYWR